MTQPFYQDDLVTIYHADWRDIAPSLRGVDLVLADPPYGIDIRTNYAYNQRGSLAGSSDYPRIAGDDKPFDPAPFIGYSGLVLWGANHFADRLPVSGSWLVWNKIDGLTSIREHGFNDGADCELAWMRGGNVTVPRIFGHRWAGMLKASEKDQRRVHPSQKPVALMGWCLSFFPDARLVFDPFMGSGPVARACKDRGIRYVGCELVRDYCERAAERCRQETLDLGAA